MPQYVALPWHRIIFLGAFARFRKVNINFMSVRLVVFPHGKTRLPLDGFSWNWYLNIFRKSIEKIPSLTKIWQVKRGTLHEGLYKFLIISCSVILGMKNILDKSFKKNQNTRFVFNTCFFRKYSVYEIIQKNVVEPERPRMPIWGMHIFRLQTHTQNMC